MSTCNADIAGGLPMNPKVVVPTGDQAAACPPDKPAASKKDTLTTWRHRRVGKKNSILRDGVTKLAINRSSRIFQGIFIYWQKNKIKYKNKT